MDVPCFARCDFPDQIAEVAVSQACLAAVPPEPGDLTERVIPMLILSHVCVSFGTAILMMAALSDRRQHER